ncbi:MAG: hypothetical protein IJI39_08900, partial [Clostridia bacterium]|nr:hypothetical protein [Clostridia bacterium]
HRETCIDKMEFDASGNIKPVTPTLSGITEPVYPKDQRITIESAAIDGNTLNYTLSAKGDMSDVDIYVVLYYGGGVLKSVAENKMTGSFEVDPSDEHLLKVLAWRKGTVEPVSLTASQKVTAAE